MWKAILSPEIPKPGSRYSQGIEVAGAKRTFYIAGQIGVSADGKLAGDAGAQHRQIWKNILAQLKAAGMGPANLVKITTYITDAGQIPVSRLARDEALASVATPPAATLVIVSALAHPDWVAEIEAIAVE